MRRVRLQSATLRDHVVDIGTVILHLPDLTAVTKTYQDFHDTGSPKEQAENIWAFRARSLAFSMAICAALAADMNQTVTSLGRAEWHNRIGPLAQQISDAQAAAQILCNRVAETKNPRPAQQPLPAHETE